VGAPRSFEDIWTPVGDQAEQLRIHSCYSAGTAKRSPVVFIPGLGLSGRTLLPTARSLSPEFPVFVVDPPGFGVSDRPANRLDLAGQASTLASWLTAVGFERAVWVGHSFGSQIAAELAFRHPELVERLVLVSPTVDPSARSMGAQVARLLYDAPREPPGLLALLTREYVKAGPRTLLHIGRLAVRDRIEKKLPAIQVPALVVRGEKDPLVPTRWAEEVTRLLPFGRLVVIPGAPHAVPYTAPSALARAVEEFCAV
jgi:2-hydroxy-6-oxonona-2,4-dienedioate hydrolase